MMRWLVRGLRPAASEPEPQRASPAPKPKAERPADDGFVQSLQLLLEHSGDGVLACDGDGRVLKCNPVAGQLADEEPSAIVGSPLGRWLTTPAGGALLLGDQQASLRRRGGAPIDVEAKVSEHRAGSRTVRVVSFRPPANPQQTAAQLTQLTMLANYDSLTGLPNRVLFRDRLARAMERSRRTGRPMTLMLLDLDRFKVVNDSLGHEVGDELLRHVARTLSHCLRSTDSLTRGNNDTDPFTVSRLGGDEFTVIAENIRGAEDAAIIARRMLEALVAPFVAGGEEIYPSASIGISMYPTDDVDLDGLIRHADMAMYRSKAMGRNTYSFFSDDLNEAVRTRLSLEGSLRRAIERDEFSLVYQPKADLATGDITGVEALLRWKCPGRGTISPDRFIAVLEDTGLVLPVGAWVVRTACAQLAAWDAAGLPPLRLAVNLSARQFRHQALPALVEDTLRETHIEPSRLELELTESLVMEDNEVSRTMLERFDRIGVKLAIDDFGTGHSSLSYLKRFSIDTLKIDRSFVRDIPDDAEDMAIATAVVALGHSLQMRVVAEGVETDAQADFLRTIGCDEIQGYLVSRPMPPAEFTEWLRNRLRERARRPFGGDGFAITSYLTLDLPPIDEKEELPPDYAVLGVPSSDKTPA